VGDGDLEVGCNKAKAAVFCADVDVGKDREGVAGGHPVADYRKASR
jgi:hypothetical protein